MVSIRQVVPLALALQIAATAGPIAYTSFQNGKRSLANLAQQMQEQAGKHIEQTLNMYFEGLTNIYELNAGAMSADSEIRWRESSTNPSQTLPVKVLASVSEIKFASVTGEFVGKQRNKEGNWEEIAAFKNSEFRPQSQSWYKVAVQTGKAAWQFQRDPNFQKPLLTLSLPLYDSNKTLLGVGAVAVNLLQINNLVEEIKVGKSGFSFLVDRSGMLLEDSRPNSENIKEIIKIRDCLQRHFDNFSEIKASVSVEFPSKGLCQGEHLFVKVIPWGQSLNLDWRLVVVMRERDFTEEIHASSNYTILMCLVAVAAAIGVGVLVARWFWMPILRLSAAAAEIEANTFNPQALDGVAKRADELGHLARMFQQMAVAIGDREQTVKKQLALVPLDSEKLPRASRGAALHQNNYLQQLLSHSKQTRALFASKQALNLAVLLQKVPFLEGFTDLQIQRLIETGSKKWLPVGECVFREKEAGDSFYIILSGSVEVYIEKINKILRKMTVGEFFGELSLLLGIPRTATVRSLEDTLLFSISRKDLQALLLENEDLGNQIAEKLRRYQGELENRKHLLREEGILEDEDKFTRNPLLWMQERMKSLFKL